jgi:hypothetical protein
MADEQDENVHVKVYIGEWGKVDMGPKVASIDVEDRDVGTDMATLVLDDTGGTNSIGVEVGQQVHIVMGWASEFAYLFVGRVRERDIISGPPALGLAVIESSRRNASKTGDIPTPQTAASARRRTGTPFMRAIPL